MVHKVVGIFSGCSSFDDYSVERALFAGRDIEIVGVNDASEFAAARGSFDALILTNAKVTGEVMSGMPHCEVVCRHGQGFDNIDVPEATSRGIKVCNVPGFNTDEVSDHALAFALMLGRNIPFYSHEVKVNHIWSFNSFPANIKICEMNLALLGFGRISRRLAEKARPLFGKVTAYDPFMDLEIARKIGVEAYGDMDSLIRDADILSIHVPLSKESYHLVSAEKLEMMKPTAYLINCARGALVDNDALNDALENGRLAGAAVDVVEPEPSPAEHVLYDQKKCVVTPHVAWYTSTAIKRMRIEAAESALAVFDGRQPGGCVN
ncbi:MAG: C-terminal binding protein [Synergistaceae bacterium]|jgi:phosphoglycerate dehydrogenase-like enzyme|nr:C-terminal binding protein [Synergistaceae bacterium]